MFCQWRVLIANLSLAMVVCFLSSIPAEGFHSASWTPGPAPAWEGPLKRNHKLASCRIIGRSTLKSPEDLAVDKEGRIYCGSAKSGNICRTIITADGVEHIEIFAKTGGFNFGLKLTPNGDLYTCNTPKGLMAVNPKGGVRLLTNKSDDGTPITFADDLDVDSEGRVYFSNASTKYNGLNGTRRFRYDLLEGNPHGALYCYDPKDKSTKLLVSGLYFANGVAVSKHEDYVLVCESCHYQITRYWLKGPKAGTYDLFATNLPGAPDGITTDPSGDFWVSLPCYRRPYLDFLQHNRKFKDILSYTPEWVWGNTPHYGFVIRMNEAGQIVESLQDPSGKVWCVTNVVPWHNYLFLGTLEGNGIARYEMKPQN
jgi:hypothetical protein